MSNIGSLNKRIELQYPTRVGDGMGGFVISWVDHATISAAVWPTSASEQIQAMGQVMTITHRIRIRYRSILRASWRISYAGRFFNIVSIIDVGMKHRWLDIMCKEMA